MANKSLCDFDVDGELKATSLDINGAADISGTADISGALFVGADAAGHDVKFFGTTSGKYMLWNESANALLISGEVGIGDTSPDSKLKVASVSTDDSLYTVDIQHTRTNANVGTHAIRVNMDLSGTDSTTADRISSGILLDIDSNADGDASDEHRIYGVNSDVRFSGYSDLVRSGYFYAESNNSTEKTAQLIGVMGYAAHDSNSIAGGVTSMYGSYGLSAIQDLGEVSNTWGGYFKAVVGTNRGDADVGVMYGVEARIEITKEETINYGTMTGVKSVIDNNADTAPAFGSQYLFKGDYQGTKGSNAWGIYTEGDKNYFEGDVGIGTTSPESNLEISDSTQATGATLSITNAHIGSWVTGDKIGSIDFRIDDTSTTQPVRARIHTEGKTNGTYPSSSQLAFSTTNANTLSEKMRITSAGNVGIGTTAPASKLHISDVQDAESLIQLHNNRQDLSDVPIFGIQAANSGTNVAKMSFYRGTGGNSGYLTFSTKEDNTASLTEKMRIDGAGNVGIGTAAPSEVLDVVGNIAVSGTVDGVDIAALATANTGDQTLPTDFVSAASGGTFGGNVGIAGNLSANRYLQSAHGIPTNNLGAPTVTEMALFDNQFGPKTTLANAYDDLSDLTFWSQATSGASWVEVTSYSDDIKRKFLRTNNSSVIIPNGVYKFRVEFVASGYTYANAMTGYWSSQSHNTQVQVYRYNVANTAWTQHTSSSTTVSSWPGHLYLPFGTIPWHETHTTSTGHYKSVRIEFTPNWIAYGGSGTDYSGHNINLYGMQIWGGYPSGRKTVHSYDQNGKLNLFGDIDVPGNMSVDGTVDGVDIATRDALLTTTNDWGDHGAAGYATTSYADTAETDAISTAGTNADARYPRGITKAWTSVVSDPGVDAWYKLFRVTDQNSNPVECHLRGYAHTAISFIVSEGYQGGGAHINVLDATVSSANSGYKYIKGLRINDLGDVEVELNGGSSVNVEITVIGDASVPATLAVTAVENPVIKDLVTTLGNGMVRAFGDITSESGKIILNGTGQITGIDTVTSGTDAANKTYVDTAETDAIATAATASEAYTDAAIVTLVDSAPGTLDTLNELATALGDDVNFSTTVTDSIATKLPLAGGTMSGAIAMGSNNITGGGTITGTTLTGSSLDINGAADISGNLTIGPNATAGGRILSQHYSGADRLGVISSNSSSGNLVLGYGAEGKVNDSNVFVSTYGNFSGGHTALQMSNAGLKWYADASNSQTTIGDDLTLANVFSVSRAGNATFAGTLDVAGDITLGSRFNLGDDGVMTWGNSNDYGQLSWDGDYALISGLGSKGIKFRTNGSSDALTLDTSQNATFEGTIGSGAITSTGLITGTSLDINGAADISGAVSIGSTLASNEYSLVTTQGRKSYMFSFTGSQDHTLTLNSGAYYQAEVTITAHQTNTGAYNNIFIRGIWSNNHETHHWDELERVGALTGGTIAITNGQNGSTAASGQLAIVHNDTQGDSFAGMTVNVIEHYGASTHVIS